MAIDESYLMTLGYALDKLASRETEKKRMLCFSYPDLLVSQERVAEHFGPEVAREVPLRVDSAEVWAWHGQKGCNLPILDSRIFFEKQGFSVDIADVAEIRGGELIVDLNYPLPDEMRGVYDVVVDTGTCEHCFNVAQAFLNACDALSEGGYLVHAAPVTKVNHGFWNFSPTVYPDFLCDNGFEIEIMLGIKGHFSRGVESFEIDPFSRAAWPSECAVYVVARRLEIKPFRWPVQRKYRSLVD